MRANVEHFEQSREDVSGLERARWITAEQLRSIEDLVSRKNGRVISRPDSDKYLGWTIYAIDEEPLAVFKKVSKRNPTFVGWVFPSEKHAQILQEAEILKFEDQKGQEAV